MIVCRKKGKLVPVGIEVNSHDCTINTQIFDFIMATGQRMLPQMYNRSVHVGANPPKCANPEEEDVQELASLTSKVQIDSEKDLDTALDNKESDSVLHPVLGYMSKALQTRRVRIQETRYYCGDLMGMSVRPFVRTMISRSQRYLIVGKKMLVIGAGGLSKKKIWPDAAAYGVKVNCTILGQGCKFSGLPKINVGIDRYIFNVVLQIFYGHYRYLQNHFHSIPVPESVKCRSCVF
jgi:hypothetical protein